MDDAPILICYDGSPGARRAITVAADLIPGLRAVVLDVGQVLTVAESYAALGPAIPDFEEYNAEQALAQAEAGAEYARRAGFGADARAGVAAPTWAGVVDVASEIHAAVIVVGSRGLRGARERLEGSVSHQIAEHAGRPVLIVPPPAREAASQMFGLHFARKMPSPSHTGNTRWIGAPTDACAPHTRDAEDMDSLSPSIELADRHSNDLDVVLMWGRRSGHLWVLVTQRRSGRTSRINATATNALDVFHHPFAYAGEGL